MVNVGKYTIPMDCLGKYIYIFLPCFLLIGFCNVVLFSLFFFSRTGIKWNVLRWRVALRIKSRCEFFVGGRFHRLGCVCLVIFLRIVPW